MARLVYGTENFLTSVEKTQQILQQAQSLVVQLEETTNGAVWTIAYFDRIRWDNLQHQLEQTTAAWRHLWWHMPVNSIPFLFNKRGKLFSVNKFGNSTLYDLVQFERLSKYSGTVQIKKNLPKYRQLIKVCVLLNMFRSSVYPTPVLVTGMGSLNLKVKLQAESIYLVDAAGLLSCLLFRRLFSINNNLDIGMHCFLEN